MRPLFSVRQFWVFVLCSLFAPLVAPMNAGAFPTARPLLNPKTVASPSGEYTLLVDPGDRYGVGKAMYRLKRKDRVVWEGTRPFTLWEAGVTDDGTVGGYAYSFGPEGWGGKKPGEYGDFEVVILDSAGQTRLLQKVKRVGGYQLHSWPNPLAAGMILDALNDRMIVREADADWRDSAETWWSYQLSSGRALRRYKPKLLMERDSATYSLQDARAVAGTPLMLVHWLRYSVGNPDSVGARFTLIDLQGKPVWHLDLTGDYNGPGDVTGERLSDEIREQGALLRTDQTGQFTVRFGAQRQRVTFAVASGEAGKWRVTELLREPFVPPPSKRVRFDAPTLSPALRDKIELHVPGALPPPAIRHAANLVSAGSHRLAFVREDTQTDLVVVDGGGAVVQTVALNKIMPGVQDTVSLDKVLSGEQDTVSKLLWRSGTRFLVFVEHHASDGAKVTTRVFEVNAETGAIAKVREFDAAVKSAASCADGGFVVLASTPRLAETLCSYDGRGRQRWALPFDVSGSQDKPETLFSPEALTVLQGGRVAVLDVIRHTVQLYDAHGHYLRTIGLDRVWGRQANYPTEIIADRQGGFVVHDFMGSPAIVWMNARGRVVRSFTPRYPSGKPIDIRSLSVGAEGDLWVSDSYWLLRLDTRGRAAGHLGEAPRADQLRAVIEMEVRPDGGILAADQRTNAIHVFDAQGRWLHVCAPHSSGAEDPFLFRFPSKQIEFGPDGAFVTDGEWFGADGKRRGAPPGFQAIKQRLKEIERHPDRTWMEEVYASATAPDGALAVLDGNSLLDRGARRRVLSFYSARGEPERMISLPDPVSTLGALAYDGALVVLVADGRLLSYGRNGEPRWQFVLPENGGWLWTPYLTEAGRTLCLFDGRRTLYRYALP